MSAMANPSPLPAHGSTSPNAASLSGIPDELLLNIIVHLHDDEDALAKLCRTDKRCKRFAQEVLYGFIRKDRAARAVARWPWLAKDVRFLECWLQEPTDKEIYLRILEYACGVRGIRMDLRHYKFSIQPMVLACLGLFNKAVDRPMDSPNQFSRLKYILIGNGSLLASPLPMKNISTLFRLPALEHLRLRGFYQTTPFRDWTVSTSTSSIKCLWIFDSMMDVTAVVQMIQSVKALQNFGYEYSTRHWEPFGREDIPVSHLPSHFWKPLGDAMKQHQYSLKCLRAFETVDKALAHNGYPDGRNVGFFGSFADFPQLKHIHLPIESLLDIQAGETDLSRYLPKQLLRFSGIIDSSNPEFCGCAASAILSLKRDPERSGLQNLSAYFRVRVTNDVGLSPYLDVPFEQLEAAGVDVYVDSYGKSIIRSIQKCKAWLDVVEIESEESEESG